MRRGEPSSGTNSLAVLASAETMELDAWDAAVLMAPGINIGNTLENTTQWETGWGNPRITREYVQRLKGLGFKTIRLPVAWDTYAVNGKIQQDKLQRVAEVVDWIIEEELFCVVNVHWDGGWIDSSQKERYPETFATFSDLAEKKYSAYWQQIASFFSDRNGRLIFEALNEETNFKNEGYPEQAFATLTRVQQLFIDTVRGTGGNNAKRLLLVAGYHTDIAKTTGPHYRLPKDSVDDRLFISVHYYTPWQFCGLEEDADWGKMMHTWGTEKDVAELNTLFDEMAAFTKRHDIPAFIGEYGVSGSKDPASRVRWMLAVTQAAMSRKMVPALWETGQEVSRHPPFEPSDALRQVLTAIGAGDDSG